MLYLILQSCSKKEIIDKPVDVMPGGKEKKSNWVPGDIVINGGYKLINLLSFKCIEMSGNGAVSPGQAQQGEYGEKAWQQWAIFNLGGGDYQIINTQSMKALAPPAGNDSEGAVLGQYTYDGTDRMKWKIIPTAGELYQIVNKGNNLNVTLENGGTADGTLITQRTYNSTSGLAILLRQLWSVQSNAGTAYCVSFSSGNDINTGLSSTVPWKTLAKVSSRKYFPGDWILLKSGDTWNNDSLVLKGNGLATRPIILNQYGSAAKPAIRPLANNRACVQLNGNAGWNISNLDLSGAKDGIRAEYDMVYGKNYLFISDCNFHDMNSTYNTKPFVYNHFSTGITINAFTFYGLGRMTFLTNFTVQNCTFTNCNAAMWTIGAPWKYCNADGFAADPHDLPVIDGVTIKNCQATNCQQMGLSAVSMKNGVVTNFDCYNIGGMNIPAGTASIVVADSENMVFDGCDINYTHRGPNLSDGHQYDGDGFDFEGGVAPSGGYQTNITLKNCSILNSDGAGIMVYDNNGSGPSINTIIDHVTVTNFGLTPGEPYSGIHFSAGTTGTLNYLTLNRNILANPFFSGNLNGSQLPIGFTISNYTHN